MEVDRVYSPDYVAKNADHLELMIGVFRMSENHDELRRAVIVFILDTSYDRQDIVVAMGRVERERGWR